ncbi:MAG: glycosyltransferase family 8 protein [Rhodobacteraceae bacterium]|nr:glycosyltransferase family 8 protein [Paracoccaceae bacterium]MBR9821235.1 glycosyltransferase family 8 protein [Paracoccaceae bacterium]
MTRSAEPPRNAVVITCDQAHLAFAAMTFHAVARLHPHRRFDLLLATTADFTLPPVLADMGVTLLRIPRPAGSEALKSTRLPFEAYLRLWVPERLVGRYDRLIYMDTDMLVQRPGLDALFGVDLGPHPLGAVLERPMWSRPGRNARDFRYMGLPPAPYFNSGLMLIDIAAWQQGGLLQRSLDLAAAEQDRLQYHDQSLLNVVLHRNWAQLHPAWNWQWMLHHPMAEPLHDPVVLHFFGPTKPWNDPRGLLPARVRAEYALFLQRHFPATAIEQGPPRGRLPSPGLARLALRQWRHGRPFARYLRRFDSEFDTLLQG